MEFTERSEEEINRRCEILQEMGFNIIHNDSHVEFAGINFDMSAIDENKFIHSAVNVAYAQGRKDGACYAQNRIQQALGLNNYSNNN